MKKFTFLLSMLLCMVATNLKAQPESGAVTDYGTRLTWEQLNAFTEEVKIAIECSQITNFGQFYNGTGSRSAQGTFGAENVFVWEPAGDDTFYIRKAYPAADDANIYLQGANATTWGVKESAQKFVAGVGDGNDYDGANEYYWKTSNEFGVRITKAGESLFMNANGYGFAGGTGCWSVQMVYQVGTVTINEVKDEATSTTVNYNLFTEKEYTINTYEGYTASVEGVEVVDNKFTASNTSDLTITVTYTADAEPEPEQPEVPAEFNWFGEFTVTGTVNVADANYAAYCPSSFNYIAEHKYYEEWEMYHDAITSLMGVDFIANGTWGMNYTVAEDGKSVSVVTLTANIAEINDVMLIIRDKDGGINPLTITRNDDGTITMDDFTIYSYNSTTEEEVLVASYTNVTVAVAGTEPEPEEPEQPEAQTITEESPLQQTFTENPVSPWGSEDVTDYPAELTVAEGSVRKAETLIALEEAGQLTVFFDYTSGNHALKIIGVDIVDGEGNVVAKDYHVGKTGGSDENNTYTFAVPAAGTYTLRYFVNHVVSDSEVNMTNGNITVSFATATEPEQPEVPADFSWLGEFTVTGTLNVVDANYAALLPSSFNYVAEHNDKWNIDIITSVMGQDVFSLNNGGILYTISEDGKSVSVQSNTLIGQAGEMLFLFIKDKNNGTEPIIITRNEDGTITMDDFTVHVINYNDNSQTQVASYSNVTVAVAGTEPEQPEQPEEPEVTPERTLIAADELNAMTEECKILLRNVSGTNGLWFNGVTSNEVLGPQNLFVWVPAADGKFNLKKAYPTEAEGEGYIQIATGGGATSFGAAATAEPFVAVWPVIGGTGNQAVSEAGEVWPEHAKMDSLVRFVSQTTGQFLNVQGIPGPAGYRGGTGGWSFNNVYDGTNYRKLDVTIEKDGETTTTSLLIKKGETYTAAEYEGYACSLESYTMGDEDAAITLTYVVDLSKVVANLQASVDTADELLELAGYGITYNFEAIDLAGNADAMLYTNAPCTNTLWGDQFESWDVLFDGNAATFFHSEYGTEGSTDGLDHYLRVDLGEGNAVSAFKFTFTTRDKNCTVNSPTTIVVEGSNEADGEYTEIATITGIPQQNSYVYESGVLGNGNAYRYIRYRVTATGSMQTESTTGKVFFFISEFGMSAAVGEPVVVVKPEYEAIKDLVVALNDANVAAKAVLADEAHTLQTIKDAQATLDAAIEPVQNAVGEEGKAAREAFDAAYSRAAELLAAAGLEVTATPVALQVTDEAAPGYIWCNEVETSEGTMAGLIDGDPTTFMHSRWNGTAEPVHYLQVELGEGNEVQNLIVKEVSRSGAANDYPETIVILGSNDGENFTEIGTISGLPQKGGASYVSPIVLGTEAYKQLRFVVTTGTNRVYFHMAEFAIENVNIAIAEECEAKTAEYLALDAAYKAAEEVNGNAAASAEELTAHTEAILAAIEEVERVVIEPLEVVSVTPSTEEAVDELETITITFNRNVTSEVTSLVLTDANEQTYEAAVTIEENTVTIKLATAIYDAGVYTLAFAAEAFQTEDGAASEAIELSFEVSGVSTGVVEIENAEVEQVIYDLTGRRVEKATNGIYIINGKKVLVK